jgi:hypothetical protein
LSQQAQPPRRLQRLSGSDDACRVIDEALSFKDGHFAARDTEALGNRDHGYGVCRVDDGTEDEGSNPRERYGPVGYRGDHADGRQN